MGLKFIAFGSIPKSDKTVRSAALWWSKFLGQREKSADELVSHIPGDMGETHELAGSRHSLRHELGQRISCGSLGGWIGKLRELLKYNLRSVKAYLCERTSIGSGPPPSATRPPPGYGKTWSWAAPF